MIFYLYSFKYSFDLHSVMLAPQLLNSAARIKLPPPCDLAGDCPFTIANGRPWSDLAATALGPPDNLTYDNVTSFPRVQHYNS